MQYEKTRSNWWFLLPILLGIIGGIIAYFVLRHDDPRKARNCLYLGIVLGVLGMMLNILLMSQSEEIGLNPGIVINT